MYAYGKLRSEGTAPEASQSLRRIVFHITIHHSPKLAAQGVSNVAWSLAKQGSSFGDVLGPLQEAAHRAAD